MYCNVRKKIYNVTIYIRVCVYTYVQPERLSLVLEVSHWTTTVGCSRWFSASPTGLKYKGSRSWVFGSPLNSFQRLEEVSAERYSERIRRLYIRSRSTQLRMLQSANYFKRITFSPSLFRFLSFSFACYFTNIYLYKFIL